ncbi:hypothetical protein ACR3AM_005471 [Bacillus thuringiensis]
MSKRSKFRKVEHVQPVGESIPVPYIYKQLRRDGNLYGVFKDSQDKYRIGEYDKRDKNFPYYVFEAEFDDISIAMSVCRMLEEAYEDGYGQGQCDCH